MAKAKVFVTKNASELAELLGLSPADGVEIAVKVELNAKIIEVVTKRKLTHAQVAKLSGTSRTRITAIMNHNTKDISTDLLLRVLGSLGYRAQIKFSKAA